MFNKEEINILINTLEILNEKAIERMEDDESFLLLETAANISQIILDND